MEFVGYLCNDKKGLGYPSSIYVSNLRSHRKTGIRIPHSSARSKCFNSTQFSISPPPPPKNENLLDGNMKEYRMNTEVGNKELPSSGCLKAIPFSQKDALFSGIASSLKQKD